MDWSGSRLGQGVGTCERGNEHFEFHKLLKMWAAEEVSASKDIRCYIELATDSYGSYLPQHTAP
jgi:hypothetical protein